MSHGALRRRGAARRWSVWLALLAGALSVTAPACGETLSLSLDEAIDVALDNSKELAAARAGAEAAQARAGQARAGFFPAISASGSYTRLDEAPYMDASQFGDMFAPLMVPFQDLVDEGYLDPATLEGLSGGGSDKIYLGDDDIYSVGLTVTQPLFTGGAILSAHGAASHGARAGALSARRAEDRLRFAVTEAYTGLVQAGAALDVMDAAAEQVRSHLSDVEAFFEEGMVLESDLMLARVKASEVELARSRAEHLVRLADAALSFVMGIDVETSVDPRDALDARPAAVGGLGALTDLALDARPDLLAANEAVAAADNGVSLARSGYFPQVVLMGSYNWDRPNREYEPEFYKHWSATLAVSMNVFDWGLTGNRVREARAGLAQAERVSAMFADAVRLEVKQGYLEHEEAVDALAIAEDGLAQAREGERIVREAFRNGAAKSSDVLDAQTALTTAEMNRIAALAGLRIADAKLALATGTAH